MNVSLGASQKVDAGFRAASRRLGRQGSTQSGSSRRELRGSWQALHNEADAIADVFGTGTK